MAKLLKILSLLAAVAVVSLPAAAFAHSRVFLGFNVGYPGYYGPPAYYYPPPVYYAPPPPVVYYNSPPAPVYAPPAPAQNCRTFNGDATIDASGQPFYGTACQGPDGRWHVTQ